MTFEERFNGCASDMVEMLGRSVNWTKPQTIEAIIGAANTYGDSNVLDAYHITKAAAQGKKITGLAIYNYWLSTARSGKSKGAELRASRPPTGKPDKLRVAVPMTKEEQVEFKRRETEQRERDIADGLIRT